MNLGFACFDGSLPAWRNGFELFLGFMKFIVWFCLLGIVR